MKPNNPSEDALSPNLEPVRPSEAERKLTLSKPALSKELAAAQAQIAALTAELATAQSSLREAHAELNAVRTYAERLIQTAYVLVVGLNRQGQVELVNQAAAQLLGYERQELLGQNWFKLVVTPDQREALKNLQLGDPADGAALPPQLTYAVQTRSGELREIEWQNSRFDRDGKFAGCFAIGVDVTQRRIAEQALSASEIRYRRLFETAKDGIIILDAHTGVVVDVNPYLSELLGLTYAQLVGRKVWELGFLKDVAASRDNFLELQKQEYIRYEDLPLETADGRRIDAEFVSNVYQVNGDLVIQCNIRNITARKKAEDALKVLHAELEQRVADRTSELAQANEALKRETVERMRAEEMQLTAVLKERTRIAREIHDTLAQGFAGIVLQLEAAEDVLSENVQSAHTHLIKARQLARDSLADARRSMWALRPQMLEKGDLVYAIGTFIETLAKETPIRIEFTHQGEHARLPHEMEEAMLRICQEALMNAGKHSRAERIAVSLAFTEEQVDLRIEDDGQGFDAASAPFLRGLGLRIMKERAKAMQGTVNIESQPGQGAKVMLRVPIQRTATGGSDG